MAQPHLILDYASPRPRGRMRLPVQSHIEMTADRDSTSVCETLKGRGGAIAAIVFAVFVLIVLLATIVSQLALWHKQSHTLPIVPAALSVLWLTEAALGAFVLDQTYRKTVIRVCDGELSLTFSALFSPTRRHCWPIQEVGELLIKPTQSGPNVTPLAELQIRPARDVSVHLFTDHHETEVRKIAAVIARAMKGEHDFPGGLPSTPAPPDGATLNQLINTHRRLREADRARQIREPEQGRLD